MKKLNDLVSTVGGGLQSAVLLLVRLAWGYMLVESGYGHLTHVEKTLSFFKGLGIPFPLANVYLSGTTELACGALMMLGLFTRLATLPLIFNFCVAYLTASRDAVRELAHFRPDDFLNDTAFPFLAACLVILAFGPGKAALDTLVLRKTAP
jgi:putative oxidoreductase